jgi:ribulose-phosphate 3-epimerase
MSPGIAVNPPTKVDALLEVMDAFDLMLVMSVNPGYSGQAFIPEVLSKARAVAARRRPEQWIEIDGGVNPQNAASVREAGVDLIVAASAIFGLPPAQRGTAIAQLRG